MLASRFLPKCPIYGALTLQRFLRGLDTFARINFVKMCTPAHNDLQYSTMHNYFCYQTSCPMGQCRFLIAMDISFPFVVYNLFFQFPHLTPSQRPVYMVLSILVLFFYSSDFSLHRNVTPWASDNRAPIENKHPF